MTSHACIKICTAKDGLMQKDNNGAAILMNETPAGPALALRPLETSSPKSGTCSKEQIIFSGA
jgi:hypothetical protein